MDPETCINIILRGTESGDYESVEEACKNLREWLANGGFMPQVNSQAMRKILMLAAHGAYALSTGAIDS